MIAGLVAALAFLSARSDAAPPRLTVLLVVDQMPASFLDRFGPLFGERGFKRLRAEGADFSQAHHPHAVTFTAPGHAVLGSGLLPSQNGIIGNEWWDRELGRKVTSVWHADGPSAWRFEGTSLAKRWKKRYPDGKVVGLALKDRSAILPAGDGSDAAFWLGKDGFTSSKAYAPRPDVLSFNETVPEFLAARSDWTYGLKASTSSVCPDDLLDHHEDPGGVGAAFPHRVPDLPALKDSPAGNELTERFARHVIRTMGLGEDDVPDFLSVSFSATDGIGHAFGPDSCEAADAMARLDRDLGRFLDFLEAGLGKDRVLVALSSDHGVAPLPEVSAKLRKKGGRLFLYVQPKGKPRMTDLEAVERDAAREFGYPHRAEEGLIAFVTEPWIWIDTAAAASRGVEPARARLWLRDRLAAHPGVERAFTSDELREGAAPKPVLQAFYPARAGDVYFELEPYWVLTEKVQPVGTTHGTDEDYDTHVPLLWWGSGVAPVKTARRVETTAVAATIALRLGLDPDGLAPDALPELAAGTEEDGR